MKNSRNTPYIIIIIGCFLIIYLFMQGHRNAAHDRQILHKQYAATAAERLQNAKQALSQSEVARKSLKLENYNGLQELQDALNLALPPGTAAKDLAQTLVEQNGAIPSVNLIMSYSPFFNDNRRLTAGSSSAENTMYYFKPFPPDSKDWQNAVTGWVLRATINGNDDALTEITALTVPAAALPNQNIARIQEILQYGVDIKPPNPFNQAEWPSLLQEHQNNSSCLADFTISCLLRQSIQIIVDEKAPLYDQSLKDFANRALEFGDQESARLLLTLLPSADALHTREKTIPPMRRLTPDAVAWNIKNNDAIRMRLLYLSGDYSNAEAILLRKHVEEKTGDDYGAIHTLALRGDLTEAKRIAHMTLEWTRETPDPNENSSALGHCQSYPQNTNRPGGMGKLLGLYIEKGEFDNAYEVAHMLRTYWQNKAYGQKSYCYEHYARDHYIYGMSDLIDHYAKNDKEKAIALWNELADTVTALQPEIADYNSFLLEKVSASAMRNNLEVDHGKIISYDILKSRMKYYDDNAYYLTPLLYALSGQKEEAVKAAESFKIPPREPGTPDILTDIFEEGRGSPKSIILGTYLKIAQTLAKEGDKQGALFFIDKSMPYLGAHLSEKQSEIDVLLPYTAIIETLINIGEKEKARATLKTLTEKFVALTPDQIPSRGYSTQLLPNKMAALYIQLYNVSSLLTWAETLPVKYDHSGHAQIGTILIEEKRWNEFDQYLPEFSKITINNNNYHAPFYILAPALLNAGEYVRYLELAEALKSTASPELPSQEKDISNGKPQKSPTDRQQEWIYQTLIAHALLNPKTLPQDVIKTAWSHVLSYCDVNTDHMAQYDHGVRYPLDNAGAMSSCYMRAIRAAYGLRIQNERLKSQ